jgi:hypothetical protein
LPAFLAARRLGAGAAPATIADTFFLRAAIDPPKGAGWAFRRLVTLHILQSIVMCQQAMCVCRSVC